MKYTPLLRFLRKILLLACPFLLLLSYYVVRDPFMVLRHYADYDHSHVSQNEGFVGWQKYKLQRAQAHYDAFIMGNSCTLAFSSKEWNRHIHAHPFRLFANSLGLADLCQMLDALDRQPHQPVRHLLVVGDREFLSRDRISPGAMHVMPPEVSHRSWVNVQTDFVQAFFDTRVLLPFLRYELTGKVNAAASGVIVTTLPTRERITNDAIIAQDDTIAKHGEAYWAGGEWDKARLNRPTVARPVVFESQRRLLGKIADFCRRHHTDLRLVIGPCTDRVATHPQDIAAIRAVVGAEHFFDYSDRQSWCDVHHYYDPEHYRRSMGTMMLNDMYGRVPAASYVVHKTFNR